MKLASLFFLYFTLLLLLVLFFFFFCFPPLIVRDNISPKFRQGWMIRWKVLQLGATVSFFWSGGGGICFRSLPLCVACHHKQAPSKPCAHLLFVLFFVFVVKKKKRETKRTVCIPPTHTHARLARLVFCLLFLPLFIVDVVWNHAVSSVFNDTNEIKVKNKEKKRRKRIMMTWRLASWSRWKLSFSFFFF